MLGLFHSIQCEEVVRSTAQFRPFLIAQSFARRSADLEVSSQRNPLLWSETGIGLTFARFGGAKPLIY
ncbi:hypothetical protein CK218_27545 [Mesorhizobium sp. WSM3879]|nr:hypothetical protein CK218_27545 [Mesorhizobium sp. WSM3879]